MARYAVSKILDLEASLEATGKEASKRRNDGSKCCQHHGVKLHSDIASQTNAVPSNMQQASTPAMHGFWLNPSFTAVWLAAFAEEQHQFFSIVWSDAHAHNLVNACERQVN